MMSVSPFSSQLHDASKYHFLSSSQFNLTQKHQRFKQMKIKTMQSTRFLIGLFGMAVSPLAHAAVTMQQIGDANAYDIGTGSNTALSQIFNGTAADDSTMVIDDFTVTAEELRITTLFALYHAPASFSQFANLDGFAFTIFSSPHEAATNLFGGIHSQIMQLGSGASITQVLASTGDFYALLQLDVDVTLPSAGTYWLGVAAVSATGNNETVRLLHSGSTTPATPGGANAKSANPADSFGTGTLSDLNVDAAYALTMIPEPSSTCLILCGISSLVVVRKRPFSSAEKIS